MNQMIRHNPNSGVKFSKMLHFLYCSVLQNIQQHLFNEKVEAPGTARQDGNNK